MSYRITILVQIVADFTFCTHQEQPNARVNLFAHQGITDQNTPNQFQ